MRTVAIETSGPSGVLALVEGERVVAVGSGGRRGHLAEWLLPELERLLSEAGWRRSQVELLAVGLGPGSFTGLRVGLATAKGLATGLGAAVVGVGSLPLLAAGAGRQGLVAPVLAASRVAVEAALYRTEGDGEPVELLAPRAGSPQQVGAWLAEAARGERVALLGGGARRHLEALRAELGAVDLLPESAEVPRPELLAVWAQRRLRERGPDDPRTLQPLYVRPVDATPPSRRLGEPRGGGR